MNVYGAGKRVEIDKKEEKIKNIEHQNMKSGYL